MGVEGGGRGGEEGEGEQEEEKKRGLHTNERHLLRPSWKMEARRT